jgi:hypothetical protein
MLFVVVETVKKLVSYNHPRMPKYRFLKKVNQYQYTTMRISSVAGYWIHTCRVM